MQETCAKCFAVHILKFENLQITWKKWNNDHQTLSFQFFINKSSILMFFVSFARFQILICEPRSIWRKFLVQSWLYLFWKRNLSKKALKLLEECKTHQPKWHQWRKKDYGWVDKYWVYNFHGISQIPRSLLQNGNF